MRRIVHTSPTSANHTAMQRQDQRPQHGEQADGSAYDSDSLRAHCPAPRASLQVDGRSNASVADIGPLSLRGHA